MQTIYHLISMLLMNKMIIVVIVIKFWLKNLINKIEGINWFQKRIIFTKAWIIHICFRVNKKNSLHKFLRPNYLYFNNKLTSLGILASYSQNTIFLQWSFGHYSKCKIDHRSDFFFLALKRKKGVEQTLHQVRMFAKYFIEGQIGLRIQIFHKPFKFFCKYTPIFQNLQTF